MRRRRGASQGDNTMQQWLWKPLSQSVLPGIKYALSSSHLATDDIPSLCLLNEWFLKIE